MARSQVLVAFFAVLPGFHLYMRVILPVAIQKVRDYICGLCGCCRRFLILAFHTRVGMHGRTMARFFIITFDIVVVGFEHIHDLLGRCQNSVRWSISDLD